MTIGTSASFGRQASVFTLMIVGGALLSWIGAVVYLRAGGITTVKPLCGVALAIVFICNGKYLGRILAACLIGGVAAKSLLGYGILNSMVVPALLCIAVLATHRLSCRYIGTVVDFRAWKHLSTFIAISAFVSALTAAAYAIIYYAVIRNSLLENFQSWWLTTTLSFAVFTPVTVLSMSMQSATIQQHRLRSMFSFALLFAALFANFISFRLPSLFLVPLALMIVSLTCEVEGAAVALVITEVVLTSTTILGHGITSLAHLSLGQQLYFTQILMGVLVAVILPTASAIGEQRRMRDRMAESLRREAQATSALRASEQRYRLMADYASDIMVQTDADGRISYISPSSMRLIGYDPTELIGTLSETNIVDEDKQSVRDAKAQLLRNGKTGGNISYRVRHKNGRILDFESMMSFIFDDDHAYRGMFAIVRDITEREEGRRELINARERADKANSAKSEFLANMSHEIRTPLTSVIGFADLLHDHGTLDERTKGFALRIRNGSRALLALINDVLDYSKLESGLISISPAPTNVIQIISEVFDLLSVQAESKGLKLLLETSNEIGSISVLVDEHRLRQILVNLVGNAIKFTDSGFVTLLVGCTAESHPTLQNRLSCRVIDSGEGIPADQLDAIFERFSQADSSTRKRHGGTGLGLSICKGLVEAMDGRIGVISEPGKGSTFWFEIAAPISGGASLTNANDAISGTVFSQGVLVVDDKDSNRAFVKAALEDLGVQVVEATNGEDAVALAVNSRFDLILMDIRMPGMGGVEAMRAIRSAKKSKCPIVAFTAEGEQNNLETLLQEGFDAALSKPLTLSQLKDCVENHIYADFNYSSGDVLNVA